MPELHEDTLGRVTALAGEVARAKVSPEVHAEGRARLVDTAAAFSRVRAPHRQKYPPAALAIAATVLVALLGFGVAFSRRPLTYEIVGAAGPSPNYVSAPDSGTSEVRFSDTSSVVATGGTRLRIDGTTSDGARVMVERGSATARITHTGSSAWHFVAGPFDVRVTGTRFTLAWDPSLEELDLTLHEGSVEVLSPIGPSRYSVAAGQRLHASVRDGTVKLGTGGDGPTGDASANAVTASKPEGMPGAGEEKKGVGPARVSTGSDAPRPPGAAARGSEPADWTDLVRHGGFRDVVLAAKERAGGVAGCLAACGAGDLRALADAARYVGDGAVARSSLLALRERFAGTRNGAAAAFLLGRTSEGQGELGQADGWYEKYLAEAPSGEFAADAFAGRMRAATARGGKDAAAPLAREYLRRFPNGVHARAARDLAGPP